MMDNENAIADIMEICQSGKNWHKGMDWTSMQNKDIIIRYRKIINEYGTPVLRKNFDKTVQILFTKSISVEDLKDEAIDRHQYTPEQVFDREGNNAGTITKWKCPLCCQSPYLMRVLHPMYPDGYLDKGGVLHQCVCVESRMKERRKLYANKGKTRGTRFPMVNAGAEKDSEELSNY